MKYPPGTVRALLESPHVSEATRAALQERLDAPPYQPQFFDADTYRLLGAVCARLLPQPDRPAGAIDLPAGIDERLHSGKADGWRYDALPPDREAYRLGLGGIQQAAQAQFGREFAALAAAEQDAVLQAVQAGTAPGDLWLKVDAPRFFEELLAEATILYYSHPLAQEEIGYVGMADLPAWTRIGLDTREDREPEEVN
ncbi:gluconate 2-dehydrogenase subunit 3 family protein [Hymenobacter sp. 15J16-1T3B]|uniref:gluconate 2-dehydrogenase subunit 3 family protein n=1 Tax=Hymenobacter sp. 15J16-1T3B TaxID=2886941 RepID=UPI001D1127D2|nr:gluconate 2-dehydrogenase subunit 3 family protein [Hymenobacter sp. 15J16-1T3B]MCC3156269.1 gluconate 2-dehydrogenase subunit 3 family protein [Hymenobacter sp. 15J16-1T3B]